MIGVPVKVRTPLSNLMKDAHLFNTFIRTARAVRSIDFILTRIVGVKGPFPVLIGLKFRIVSSILLAIVDRVRSMIAKQFNVAFTKIASLLFISHILKELDQ